MDFDHLDFKCLFFILNFKVGFDHLDFRIILFFILDFKVVFDNLDFKSRFIIGGMRSVLRFKDFSTHSPFKRS